MTTLSRNELLEVQNWRYAVKKFDATRKIAEDDWEALEKALILTPTSYGLQHWKAIVVRDAAFKKELRAVSWKQSQVEDCSHYVVLAAKRTMTEADVDRFIAKICEVRGIASEKIKFLRDMMIGDFVSGPRRSAVAEWTARQAYIALGNLMTSAALMGIDSCPMEGLDPLKYDEILGLSAGDYRTVVACALGYRSPEDPYAGLKKVRFDAAEMVNYR